MYLDSQGSWVCNDPNFGFERISVCKDPNSYVSIFYGSYCSNMNFLMGYIQLANLIDSSGMDVYCFALAQGGIMLPYDIKIS